MKLLDTLNNIKDLKSLLDRKDKFKVLKILVMLFLSVGLEILGLSLIAPIVSLLQGVIYQGPSLFTIFDWDLHRLKLEELLILILFVILVKNIFQFYSNHYQNKVGFFFQKKLSKKTLNYYLNIDYLDYLKIKTSDVLNDIIKVVNTVCQYTFLPLFYLVTEVLLISGIFVYLLIFDFRTTTFIGLFFGVSLIVYNIIVGKKILLLGEIVMYNDAKKIKRITESILSYIPIKLGGYQSFFIKKFDIPNKVVTESLALQFSLRQLPKFYFEFLLYVFLLILVIISYGTDQQDFITKIGVYIASLIKITPSLNRITGAIQSIKFSQSSIKRLVSFNLQKEVKRSKEKVIFKKRLSVEGVNYGYKKEEKIFNNFSFSIPKNSIVGIIGESGVGKSTLLNLLLGNLLPQSGVIKIDDLILSDKNKFTWQKKIGYVTQKIYLLDEPIDKNIAFGVPQDEIDYNRIREVVEMAKISTIFNQLNTTKECLGENGNKLSGGQVQRVGLARALYSDPEILFFDEFTSALDYETEKNILIDIQKLKLNKTIVLISHKKSVLRFCDKVIDLNRKNP